MEIGILGTTEMKGNGCDEKYKWGREIKQDEKMDVAYSYIWQS